MRSELSRVRTGGFSSPGLGLFHSAGVSEGAESGGL